MMEFGLNDDEIKFYNRNQPSESLNFIHQNIRISQKFNQIKKVHHLSRLKINLENQEKSNQIKEVKTNKNRENLEKRMKKWNDFRKRKNFVVERYLFLKRR